MNNFAKRSIPNVPIAMAFVALGFVALVPGNLWAQTEEPNVLHACYIPHVGLVYRIKEPGLRSECQRRHVEFSWNEKGPKGDQGDPGPPGPPSGGGLTKTVFAGTCVPNGAVIAPALPANDGAVISDPAISLADPPTISAYQRFPFTPAGTFESHSYGDDLFIQDGKIIIECSVGVEYKIVMIQ